jgi:aryl-alcohol dehydrogenase-like predicted oxidoreductase
MDGKSEELIGKVLKENPQFSPTIVTKGGFFGPQDKEEIEKALEYQITKSLNKLNTNSLDVFLIHNPETYFLTESIDEGTICKKISEAMTFLETMVAANKIKFYGISSNTFSLPPGHSKLLDLEKIIKSVSKKNSKNHFKWIEFPLNLMERSPLEQFDGHESLIEKAKKHGPLTLTNSPLNAYQAGHTIRLATCEKFSKSINYDESQKKLE